jgi:hypothetical protein
MTPIPTIPNNAAPKILEPPQSAPEPSGPQKSTEPRTPKPADEFLDPVSYELPAPAETKSAAPMSSKEIMKLRAERRAGRAAL